MKRQTGFLVFLASLILFICGRPLAAQDPDQPGDPAGLQNRILVDPAPGQTWSPYEMVIEGTTPVPAPSTINRPLAVVGMMDYVQYDVLLVIYTNTAAGRMSGTYVELAKENARRTRDFIWRNSHFKLFLNLTFLVVDEYVDETEFLNPMPCNWMWPDDYDGDGESPSADILGHGFVKDQFDSINLLWPNSHHGTISLCPYGGLAWGGGFLWQHLGHTMYTTNVLYPTGASLWNPFNHEFQHSIDGAFALNGRPEYFDADHPWAEYYRFGDNWHFHAVQMRHFPIDHWLDLVGEWGRYQQAPDVDWDGVPDSGDLPVTEMTLGSSTASVDSEGDGFYDRQEAMAGMFRASDPLASNSDGDAWEDADDFAPLYPVRLDIIRAQHNLDGNPAGWTLLTDHLEVEQGAFSAAVYANWDDGMFYLMFKLNQMANIQVRIDGEADGYWHGRDNYRLDLTPSGDPLRSAAVQDCTPRQTDLENHCRYDDDYYYAFDRLIDPADIGRYTTFDGEHYIVQVAIPADADSGFDPRFAREIGLAFGYTDVNKSWGRSAWTFEEDDLVYLRFLTADAAWIDGQVFDLGNCGDAKDPLAGPLASFTGKSGQKYDIWADQFGHYSFWLFEDDNPYTLTVSRWGYETQVYEGIVVNASGLNQHEAGLRMVAPCVGVDPDHSSLTLGLGTAGQGSLTITNDGLEATDFSLFFDYDGGYQDWLVVSPLDGRVEAGGETEVTVYYDAGLPGAASGTYAITLIMITDDPYSPMGHYVTLEIVDNKSFLPLVGRP